ncbi:hypothetical protein ACFQRK_06570 [Parapedobacter sp. GCM10030251]|uniref:hypothetical protein n=1 Tax=Parapedobacter sp. GCM10030251 TaxID=3273419 RepID=UPI003618FC82
MERRDFLKTSAGLLAVGTFAKGFSIESIQAPPRKFAFRNYQEKSSVGRVKIVTPDDGYYIHTFFDVCPFSPSQQYLAVNKLPYQGRHAIHGDTVDICVIDLENETIEKVYSTKGWGYQLGANLNWGRSDRYLYTNDIIDGRAVCVRIDTETKAIKAFAGPMYHMAPDESAVIGFPLEMIDGYQDGSATQVGYGVPSFGDRQDIIGAPADQGLWKTDLATNQTRLLLSLKDALGFIDDPFYKGANCYFFHSKYNLQGTRILQVFRGVFPGSAKYHPTLLSFKPDGTDLNKPLSQEQWSHRANHPNWHPDGEQIVMNVTPAWLGEQQMRFCSFHYTGSDFKILSTKHAGSGHPSVDATSAYLISDYYVGEYRKLGYKDCPIRLIHLSTGEEVAICEVFTDLDIRESTFRIDPHPVWSRDYKKVCFNGAPGGVRQVFVADLSGFL